MTTRLPLWVRAAVIVVLVLGLLAVAGVTAVVQHGAGALRVGGGFIVSSRWSPGPHWAGIELENTSALPVTLEGVVVRGAENIRVLDTRVIDPARDGHLLLLGSPLPPGIRDALGASVPVDGFVLPPRSRHRYQLAVRFEPRSEGVAVLGRTSIVYSVLGLDHGAVSDGVYCVRAPGADGCPAP